MEFYNTTNHYAMFNSFDSFEDYGGCLAELDDIRYYTSPELGGQDHADVQLSLSPESYTYCNDINGLNVTSSQLPLIEESWRPTKLPQTNSIKSPSTKSSRSAEILSFSNTPVPSETDLDQNFYYTYEINDSQNQQAKANKKRDISALARAPNVQDHILAERKRREKLNQGFSSLSAMVPGLKKMDKTSILETAIKHMKQMQDKIKILEEQVKERRYESAVVCVRKYSSMTQVTSTDSTNCDDQSSSTTCSNNDVGNDQSSNDIILPEIEARVLEKTVLIRIHCDKRPGLLGKILSKLEELRLSVNNNSVMPFGNHHTLITIIAQMEAESDIKANDLVQLIRDTTL